MYLAMLNEEQKQLFLGFAYYLASMDGDYSDNEKQMIGGYCQEMQIAFRLDEIDNSLEDIIVRMEHLCEIKEKKIIIFEAIGLAMSDGSYDEKERMTIRLTSKRFGLEASFDEACECILNEYINFQNKINKMIIG